MRQREGYTSSNSLFPLNKKPTLFGESVSFAPRVGLEPTTLRLTAACSTIELSRNGAKFKLQFLEPTSRPCRDNSRMSRQGRDYRGMEQDINFYFSNLHPDAVGITAARPTRSKTIAEWYKNFNAQNISKTMRKVKAQLAFEG